MRKFIATAMAAMVVGGVMFAASAPTTSQAEETQRRFPYWSEGAHSETDNNARKDLVQTKVDELAEKQQAKEIRVKELKRKLRQTRHRAHTLSERRNKNVTLLHYLNDVTGYTEWLYGVRMCESTNNYERDSDSGTYHGAYQFAIGTWSNYGGYHDPHTAPWYVQDAGTVYEREQSGGGTSDWPHCG